MTYTCCALIRNLASTLIHKTTWTCLICSYSYLTITPLHHKIWPLEIWPLHSYSKFVWSNLIWSASNWPEISVWYHELCCRYFHIKLCTHYFVTHCCLLHATCSYLYNMHASVCGISIDWVALLLSHCCSNLGTSCVSHYWTTVLVH